MHAGEGLLVNSGALRSLYGNISNLSGVRIRSVNLNWRGPTLRLRIDLPTFPVSAPREWIDAGMDTVQCQFQFLAAENISLTAWDPPTVGDVEMTPLGSERRMRVTVHGLRVALRFECSESVGVSHVSAFKIGSGGSDNGPHLFVSRLDARRHTFLPATDEKTFYER
ncbi:Imm50 family immunity protein [Streptomyces sp. NPDC005474]|uniref:Imm50 family immunity protein n=1 Tax=Streptomyces sp. NPDC005474 TaxID=3154878 RepID=UPI0034554D53